MCGNFCFVLLYFEMCVGLLCIDAYLFKNYSIIIFLFTELFSKYIFQWFLPKLRPL